MEPLTVGTEAPSLPGAPAGPFVVAFYKVTCPVCQLAAPVLDRLAAAAPGRVVAVGQDPEEALAGFRATFGIDVPTTSDTEPYARSNAWGIRIVPTVFLVAGGRIADVVESWDRGAYERIGRGLAAAIGAPARPLTTEGDGLPPFRPG